MNAVLCLVSCWWMPLSIVVCILDQVGWTTWEEVNRGGSGANFGW